MPVRRTTRALLAAAVGTTATAWACGAIARADASSVLIGWVALVPWLVVLDRTRSGRGALAAGAIMSAGFVVAVFAWLPRMIADYTGAPWLVGVGLLLALAPVLEPQFVAFALARHLARRGSDGARWWLTGFIGAGVYVGTEWAWPKLFADTLGHGLHASARLRQAADLGGAHGLTFALLAGNACVLEMLRGLTPGAWRLHPSMEPRSWVRRVAVPASCLTLLVGGLGTYGTVRLRQLERRDTTSRVTIAMVQGNIAHYDRLKAEVGAFEAVRQVLDTHFTLSADALRRHRPDMLVWPETVYPTTFGTPKSAEGADFDRSIGSFVADTGVPLLLGTYVAEGTKEFNAAILLDPVGDGRVVVDEYRKSRLFPFTERLPWLLDSDRVRRSMPWAGTWTPGDGPRVLAIDVPGRRRLRFAPLICYDALDPGLAIAAVRQGAELLVTLSNDSWFAFPGVQRLILIVSAFRSVETRRPQLRSTPTGVSAVIDEGGALLAVLATSRREILVGAVRPADDTWTLMLAWGDWLPPTALGASLLVLLIAHRQRRTRERQPGGGAMSGTASIRPGRPGGAMSGGTIPSSGSATGSPLESTNS